LGNNIQHELNRQHTRARPGRASCVSRLEDVEMDVAEINASLNVATLVRLLAGDSATPRCRS
jgi:hypothetical protein